MQRYKFGNVRERRENNAKDAKDAKKKQPKFNGVRSDLINWGQNPINFGGAV